MHYPIPFSAIASRLALGALCLSSFAFSARAAAVYWDLDPAEGLGGTGTWEAAGAANWNLSSTGAGALQAWANGDSANFDGSGVVTVASGVSTTGINFRTGASSYNLSGAAINFTTASFGSMIGTNSGTSAIVTISNDLILADAGPTAGNQYNFGAQGAANITLSGNFSITGATAGTNTVLFNLYGGSSFTFAGSTTGASRIAFSVGVSGQNGTTTTLSGSNAPIAATVINGGTLVLDHNSAAGTQGITLANGSTSAANTANLMIGAGRSVNNAITVTSNSADTNSTDVRQIGGNFTTGTASYTGAISVGAQKQALGLQVTATDAGRVNFTNTISGAGAITKVGTGTVSFSRPGPNGNTYTGGTTIAAGTFLANGVNSTGTGAVVVNGGATLGGSGALGNATTGAVTAQAGAFLAPGDGGAGTLTFNGALDVSGLASGTGGLLFDLGATSDQIVLSAGTLNIGAGILNFDDFNFTTLTGFDVGSYTLIATSTSIVGTLGSALTGTVGGLNGVLSMVGDDIVLTVTSIPEPSTYAALFGVVALGGAAWRRRAGLRSRSV